MRELLALALAVSCLQSHVSYAQLTSTEKVLITVPNLLRVGVNETVTVSVFNTNVGVQVTVYLEKRERGLAAPYSTSTLTAHQGAPVTTHVMVDPQHLLSDVGGGDQYVFLVASAPALGFHEEKEILVSSRAGYLLLQTDKPIYTPNQEIKIRVVAVDQDMKPSTELVHVEVRNPQGIMVEHFPDTRAVNGFLDETFSFDSEPMLGNWSVNVLHGLQFQKNESIKFEVKKYVLPRFTIGITTPQVISRRTNILEVNFEAKYVYKKVVEGSFSMIVGVQQRDGSIVNQHQHTGSLDQGIGVFFTALATMLGHNWFDMYEGSRLYVEVRVTEKSTGVTEIAVDNTTPFVASLYRFKRDQTVEYFKPGLPYDVQFELETVLGQPALYKQVVLTEAKASTPAGQVDLLNAMAPSSQRQMTDMNSQVRFTFNTTFDTSQIRLTVKIEQEPDYENAEMILTANPYQTPAGSGSYISIHIDQHMLRVGDEVFAIIRTAGSQSMTNLHLLGIGQRYELRSLRRNFIAQGKVVLTKAIDRALSSVESVFFQVTSDMVPGVRVVGYSVDPQGLVVADSLAIKVEHMCKHQVGLNIEEAPLGETKSYLPESPITLLVDGHPTSWVGLLGVDKAVYALNNKHRLTRSKLFDLMKSHDVGCGPGGGPTTPIIFKDSGLMVLSNALLAVPAREGVSCPAPSSRKRRNTIEMSLQNQLMECLLPLNDICEDNLTNGKMGQRIQRWGKCEKISSKLKYFCVSASEEDIKEFTACCNRVNKVEVANPDLGRTGIIITDPSLTDGDEGTESDLGNPDFRTDFKETWLFDLVHINSSGRESLDLRTPGSITEWSIGAVSVTPTGGLCVTDPLEVKVFKNLSVQLTLPYTVVRMEQIEVIATIYNYYESATTVEVSFYTPAGCCGESSDPSVPSTRSLTVAGKDSQSLKFVIKPVDVGEMPIRITVTSSLGNDGVEKILKVIPNGKPMSVDHSVLLDPSGIYRHHRRSPRMRATILEDIQSDQVVDPDNNIQLNSLDLRLPDDIIPETESAVITLIGNMLGPILVDPIGNYGDWLQLPRGCGEQTMSLVAPTIFVFRYLQTMKLTNVSLEQQALDRITRGLANSLAHRRQDGSFAIWGDNLSYNSSTWLTAFSLKVFSHADDLTQVDPQVTCRAAEWLVVNGQQANGSFAELYKVHHKEMTGGVTGEAAMTAYVLISLLESHWCDDIQQVLDIAITRARLFLETQYGQLTRPYAKAIVTYALALAKSDFAVEANLRLRNDAINNAEDGSRHWTPDPADYTNDDLPHWYRFSPSAIAVETTGYALLAQLALREISYAGSVALWLSEQQNYQGGFVSTQDSVIALQALIKYSDMASSGDDIDMICVLTSDVSEKFRFEHQFLPHNALVQREIKVPVGGRLRSECRGKGTGKLSVRMSFHREPNSSDRCPFEVSYDAQEARSNVITNDGTSRSRVGGIIRRSTTTAEQLGRTKGDFVVEIQFCARYLENTRSNMGIIDVGLYSGFVPVESDLEDMVLSQHLDLVQRFEVTERSVIFYVDRIPQNQEICIRFNARRELHVGNVQPVAIRVYDYYSPDKSCTSFYHPLQSTAQVETLCNDEHQCICSSERCVTCSRQDLDILEDLACKSNEHYALRVRIESSESRDVYQVYTGNVTHVIKASGADSVSVGDVRTFYIKQECDCPKFKMSHEFTVIGSAGLGYVTETGVQGYKYMLDDRSMVESWPTKLTKRRNQLAHNKLLDLERNLAGGCT